MAAGYLSEPGTEYGPCEECDHRDCAETRSLAAKVCPECAESIGYGRGFYQDGTWTTLTHSVCEYKRIAREKE